MFEDYKVVYCSKCVHSVFPQETAPWGTCCEPSKDKQTICKTVRMTCNKFNYKEKGKELWQKLTKKQS